MPFSKVNAVYKCFQILDLLSRNKGPMGTSEIAAAVRLNKSTVYNIVNSLTDLGVLNRTDGKYHFGPKLYLLGQSIDYETLVTSKVRPFLERLRKETNLSVCLGIRSGARLVVLERLEVPGGVAVSRKGRIRPITEGAHGKALLAMLPDSEIKEILATHELVRHTAKTVTDKERYLEAVLKIRDKGVAIDREELYEGIWAVAAAFHVRYLGTQGVIWAVGLETRTTGRDISSHAKSLKDVCSEIEAALNITSYCG